MSVNLGKPLRLRNDSGAQLELERGGIVRTLTVNASGVLEFNGTQNMAIVGGSINGTPIGGTTASTGAFTNLSYTGTLTGGTGVVNLGSGQLVKDASGNVGIGTTPVTGVLLRVQSGDANTINSTKNTLDTGTCIISAVADNDNTSMFVRAFGSANAGFVFGQSVANWVGAYSAGSSTAGVLYGATANVPVIFGTNNLERMRITSAGNVGIGVTAPVARLQTPGQVVGGPSDAINAPVSATTLAGFTGLGSFNNSTAAENIDALYLRKGSTDGGSIGISFGSAGGDSYFVGARIKHIRSGSNSNGHLAFETKSDASINTTAERLRITSDGYVRLSANSPGIQFNGDTAAANALNDYEEGTWTPTLQGTTTAGTYTYTTRKGVYTKIGDLVWVNCEIQIAGVTSAGSGIVRVAGLPFTAAGTSLVGNFGSGILYHFGAVLSKDYSTANPGVGTSIVDIVSLGVDGTQATPAVTAWGAGNYLRFQFAYKTS